MSANWLASHFISLFCVVTDTVHYYVDISTSTHAGMLRYSYWTLSYQAVIKYLLPFFEHVAWT